MNKFCKYTSIFAPYIENYIHEMELMEYKATQLKWILLEFDKFFTNVQKGTVYQFRGHSKMGIDPLL